MWEADTRRRIQNFIVTKEMSIILMKSRQVTLGKGVFQSCMAI
jgi:hypothetical protein